MWIAIEGPELNSVNFDEVLEKQIVVLVYKLNCYKLVVKTFSNS